MKRLLIISLFFSSIHFDFFAQTSDVHQLEGQMKNFSNRMRIYAKCLTGKCTKQERNAAAKAAIKDGAIVAGTLTLIGLTIGIVWGGRWLYTKKQKEDLFKRLQGTAGHSGIASILLAVEGAMQVAFQVDQNKKLMVFALDAMHGPTIFDQFESSNIECQTEVHYRISDHSTNITLHRCDNQVIVDVNRVGTLNPLGAMVLLNDLYKEARIYKLHISLIQKQKLNNNIDKIVIRIPITENNIPVKDEQGNQVIKTIEL